MELEITKIVLKNFRAFDHAEFNFKRTNHIFGDNGTGKSSIAEGVVFALYGTTIYGTNRTDPIMRIGSKCTEAEVTVRSNGKERVLRRVKTPECTEVFLDGVKVSQKLIQEKLLKHLEVKQFLMSFSPLYFDTLDTGSLRDLIVSLTVPLTRQEVFERLTEKEREVLGGTDFLDQAKLKKDYDGLEKKKEALSAQVELLKKQLAEKTSAEKPSSVKNLEGLEEQKNKLKALQDRKDNLEKSIGDPPPAPGYINVTMINEQINQLRKKVVQLKVPAFKAGDKCPTCGLAVSDAAIKQLQDSLNAQRNEVIASGQALKGDLEAAVKKNAAAKAEYDKALAEWQAKQTEFTNLNNEITKLNKWVVDNAVSDEREKDRKKLETDLREKEAKIAEMDKDLSERREVLGSLNAYRLKKVEMQASKLGEYLDHVSIKLFDVVKSTGEMSDTFKLLYDGKPSQFLSFSEKMRVGLELGQMFRKLSGVKTPYFLDNAESIGRPPKFDVQSFNAWFVLGSELEVKYQEDLEDISLEEAS